MPSESQHRGKTGRLSDRVALITGASRGIGRAVAKRFAEEGAIIVALARTRDALESLDDEIYSLTGKNAVLVDSDLTQYDVIDQVGEALFHRFKRLDIIVGVAGTLGQLSPISHIPLNIWEQTFALHVTANWRLLRSVDALLRQSDAGRSLFVTCDQGTKASPFWGAYGASKAALDQMVLTYAQEMVETNVKANLIDPGPVRTALRLKAFPGEDKAKLPMPEDITEKFVEMASASYEQTGQRVTL